ncbi:MAG: FtsW/RodA/SpoVE family cell cycle protein, partial [Oscillospiraceae bacterium]|nr:FtsW/RodA/SpoVE family cell cycle protein [Oscillospiraceae bacterium]
FQKNRILSVYYPGYFTYADPTRNQKLQAEFKEIIYQQQQAQYAIGSGQLTGKGLFKGSFIQSGSVPESQIDMIFSVAGEELGFLGAVAVILVIGLIVLRMIRVSSRTRVFRARLLCFGVAVMIGAQSVINIGMCIKLLPVIGITLPFFSAGGSSNLTLYAAIGLAMLVYRRQNEHEDTETYMDYLFAK